MREFKDKVAVITGAASGIGRALADRCVKEGMKVVLADLELDTLTRTEESMKATVLAVRTDVSQAPRACGRPVAAKVFRIRANPGAV
ncbi:MAG: SDR family NAD(P)-dependent oxidoreductase [Planctomycetes bacterium]|nr:SDR family NAD(P)-dependent oxidoreductase [Planctomycetota bacterium]